MLRVWNLGIVVEIWIFLLDFVFDLFVLVVLLLFLFLFLFLLVLWGFKGSILKYMKEVKKEFYIKEEMSFSYYRLIWIFKK